MSYPELHMIIDGERIPVGQRRTHTVVNPATGAALGQLPLADAADLDRALAAAQRGFRLWRDAAPQQRAAVLAGAARLLRERQEEIARTATLEQGKTLTETRLEVLMNVGLFEFYAGECQRVYGRQLVRPAGMRSTVVHEPVGPVAAFAPWNFPIGNPGRKLGAPIAAGCSVILKAAEEAPASALAVLQCLLDAGLPKEVGQAVFGVPDEVSRHLLSSPIIRKLSFTGSTVVGKHLMKLAAEDCKRTTMELGGHGAVLVFEDVDVEQVLNTMVASKFRNAGQVCISPTRFIVHEAVYERFLAGFTQRAGQWRVGNGLEEGVQMGPMANPRRPEAMERLIGGAVSAGARLHAGGQRIGTQGYFYAPTVLSEVPPEQPHHERGTVRAGRAHQSLPHRGGDDRGGQPPALRSGLLQLDERCRTAEAPGPRSGSGHVLYQHHRARRPRRAVRRRQMVRPRLRERAGRRDGVPGRQGGPRRVKHEPCT